MTAPIERIETALRRAPTPSAPNDLRDTLIRDIHVAEKPARSGAAFGWRRWWAVPLGIGVAMASIPVWRQQQAEMARLHEASVRPPGIVQTASPDTNAAQSPEAEIARLRTKIAGLTNVIEAKSSSAAEGASAPAAATDPRVEQGLAELSAMQERAGSIVCVNNLKNIGLAARTYALDNGGIFPPDFISMTNELATPKILFCPSDTSRQRATNWSLLTPANISYQYLAPGTTETDPARVAFLCPVHGTVCLVDGSVQKDVAKNHPDWLQHRDGKLYYQEPKPSISATASEAMRQRYGLAPGTDAGKKISEQTTPSRQMDPAMMKRYGLAPQQAPASKTPPEQQ
jgi:hypothetical protein